MVPNVWIHGRSSNFSTNKNAFVYKLLDSIATITTIASHKCSEEKKNAEYNRMDSTNLTKNMMAYRIVLLPSAHLPSSHFQAFDKFFDFPDLNISISWCLFARHICYIGWLLLRLNDLSLYLYLFKFENSKAPASWPHCSIFRFILFSFEYKRAVKCKPKEKNKKLYFTLTIKW